MQVKPDTHYRTADGDQIYVAAIRPDGVAIGWDVNRPNSTMHWDKSGRCFIRNSGNLIAIWTDRPADEDGWEIVEGEDSEELIVGDDWQCNTCVGWGRVSHGGSIGHRVGDRRITGGDLWRWFRRPVKRVPREFIFYRHAAGHLSTMPIRGWERIESVEKLKETN